MHGTVPINAAPSAQRRLCQCQAWASSDLGLLLESALSHMQPGDRLWPMGSLQAHGVVGKLRHDLILRQLFRVESAV